MSKKILKHLNHFCDILLEDQVQESILDEPRDTLSPKIWSLSQNKDDLPSINPEVKKEILRGLEYVVQDLSKVKRSFIVGSITGYRYGEDADIDVSILVQGNDNERYLMGERAIEINGRFAPKTTNPINYYVMPDNATFERFDSVYDLLEDKWLKPPKDFGVDLYTVYEKFKSQIKEIDVEKSETIRSLVDIEALFAALENSNHPAPIFWKLIQRIKDLDSSISDLAKKYDQIHQERIQAFLNYEAGKTKNLPSPNLLPENIRYKLLERYHYLDFMHNLYKLVKETGKIDTIDDIQKVREILQGEIPISEEAGDTCPEYRMGGFRNHDEVKNGVDEGRDLFEKALKRMNDKALGKFDEKSAENKIEESIEKYTSLMMEKLGSYTYTLPKDKEEQLYDFYISTLMQPSSHSSSKSIVFDVKDLPDEDLDYALEDTQNKLYSSLKESLLEAVLFSICAEIRHVLDRNEHTDTIEMLKDPKQKKLWKSYLKDLIIGKQAGDLQRTPENMRRSFQENQNSYLVSYKSALNAIKKTKSQPSDFVEICKFLFEEATWSQSYGGKAWQQIAEAWLKLDAATTNPDKTVWIDHIYDLQHNTDTVFNKVKSYLKNGSYRWLKNALDNKFEIKNPYEIFDKISPQMKRLAGYYFKSRKGTSFEQWVKDNNKEQPKVQSSTPYPKKSNEGVFWIDDRGNNIGAQKSAETVEGSQKMAVKGYVRVRALKDIKEIEAQFFTKNVTAKALYGLKWNTNAGDYPRYKNHSFKILHGDSSGKFKKVLLSDWLALTKWIKRFVKKMNIEKPEKMIDKHEYVGVDKNKEILYVGDKVKYIGKINSLKDNEGEIFSKGNTSKYIIVKWTKVSSQTKVSKQTVKPSNLEKINSKNREKKSGWIPTDEKGNELKRGDRVEYTGIVSSWEGQKGILKSILTKVGTVEVEWNDPQSPDKPSDKLTPKSLKKITEKKDITENLKENDIVKITTQSSIGNAVKRYNGMFGVYINKTSMSNSWVYKFKVFRKESDALKYINGDLEDDKSIPVIYLNKDEFEVLETERKRELTGKFEGTGLSIGDEIKVADLDEKKLKHELLYDNDVKKYKKASGKIGTIISQSDDELINVKMKNGDELELEPNEIEIIKNEEQEFQIQNLTSDMNLKDYFLTLEAIVNKTEFTGGRMRRMKVSSVKGQRVDRGSRGALNVRGMSARERSKRKLGAMKGNVKAKVQGKTAIGNRKKVIGQKLNPNSPKV